MSKEFTWAEQVRLFGRLPIPSALSIDDRQAPEIGCVQDDRLLADDLEEDAFVTVCLLRISERLRDVYAHVDDRAHVNANGVVAAISKRIRTSHFPSIGGA
jgi:hypothetical protein